MIIRKTLIIIAFALKACLAWYCALGLECTQRAQQLLLQISLFIRSPETNPGQSLYPDTVEPIVMKTLLPNFKSLIDLFGFEPATHCIAGGYSSTEPPQQVEIGYEILNGVLRKNTRPPDLLIGSAKEKDLNMDINRIVVCVVTVNLCFSTL